MRDYSKTGDRSGKPAYGAPALYRKRKEEEVVKIRAHNVYEKIFRRKSFGRRG